MSKSPFEIFLDGTKNTAPREDDEVVAMLKEAIATISKHKKTRKKKRALNEDEKREC